MFFLDPKFSIPYPGSRVLIPGSGSAAKNLRISSHKIFMIRTGCSSQIPYLDFLRIPDPRSRGQKGTRSRDQKGKGSWIQGSKRHRIPDPGVKKAPHPGSRGQKGNGFWIQGSKRQRIPDLGVKRHRIPDPGVKRHRIPDPGFKKATDPGSGSATLVSRFISWSRRPN